MHQNLKVLGSLGLIGVVALVCYLTPIPWLVLLPLGCWCLGMAWDYYVNPPPRTLNSYTPQEVEIMRIRDELESWGDFAPPEELRRLVRDYRHISGS